MVDRTCMECAKKFQIYPCRAKESHRGKFCSMKCFHTYRVKNDCNTMDKNPNWKGGRKNFQGYIKIRTQKNLYEFEHRVVAEKTIGRKLKRKEIVHHINGVKNDNRPENLIVIGSQSEHAKAHSDNVSCPTCGRFMPRS